MPIITKISDLDKILAPKIVQAMELTKQQIFDVVSKKVTDYYSEKVFSEPDKDIPTGYDRTGNLLESLTASNVTKTSSGYMCTVGWDDEYLTFSYPGNPNDPPSSYNPATGLQVLTWMNSKSHGGTVKGYHNYWDEALAELGGENGIRRLFIENLRKCGVPIK